MDFNGKEVLIEVTPLEKKSIERITETWDSDAERGVTITELYRWGRGYLEGIYYLENPQFLRVDGEFHCDPHLGHGCEMDDEISVWFEYDGEWTEEEQEQFEVYWYNGDPDDPDGRIAYGWLEDYQTDLEVESEDVRIVGPVKFSIVDANEYNKVYVEDYKPNQEQQP